MTHLVDVLVPPPPVVAEPDLLWSETVITEQLQVLIRTADLHTQDIGPAFDAITEAAKKVGLLRYAVMAERAAS